MEPINNKFDLLDKIKSVLETNQFEVSEIININYGLQFEVIHGSRKGLVRIYENKKGVRLDLSQITDSNLRNYIAELTDHDSVGDKVDKKQKPQIYTDNNIPADLIGTDESGKGDFFGPLVIAGVFLNKQTASLLESRGVTDSKKLSDSTIGYLASDIKKTCPYSIVVIGNERYNQLYEKMQNLNKILGWGHARVIENILGQIECQCALSDQFGDESLIKNALMKNGKEITLFQRPKAEEVTAVAAASILARNEFVLRMRSLSNKYNVSLPKGASNDVVSIAKSFIKKYSREELNNVAKIHFSTTEKL